jgi:hypothetical protein
MSLPQVSTKRTYFGIASLAVAALSTLLLGAFYGISQMDITAQTFSMWNNVLAILFCSTAPIALILGGIGLGSKHDSKGFAWIAILLVSVPFIVMTAQMLMSLSFAR